MIIVINVNHDIVNNNNNDNNNLCLIGCICFR